MPFTRTQCNNPADPNLNAKDASGNAICSYSSPGVASGPIYSAGSDLDAEANAVTFETLCEPTKGTFVWTSSTNGNFTYTPTSNQFGEDTIVYQVSDLYGATSEPAVLTIPIANQPDISVAVSKTFTTVDGPEGAKTFHWINGTFERTIA